MRVVLCILLVLVMLPTLVLFLATLVVLHGLTLPNCAWTARHRLRLVVLQVDGDLANRP